MPMTFPTPTRAMPMAATPDLLAGLPVWTNGTVPDGTDGVLLVDKPQGMTSFDVIRYLRPRLGLKTIGHAGTLDPMATGLLVCLVGRATKAQETLQGQPKAYDGTLKLGEVTPSQDADTEVAETRPTDGVTDEAIRAAVAALTGPIEQLPPMYSAVKVDGQRLYKAARRGEEVERKVRPVMIYRFDVDAVRMPEVDVFVACSKGTYIRTLAHDLGAALGCGAHLTRLRRVAAGDFSLDDAWALGALCDALGKPLRP